MTMNKCCPDIFFAVIVVSLALVITIANVCIEATVNGEQKSAQKYHPFLLELEAGSAGMIPNTKFAKELKLYKQVYPHGTGNEDLDSQLDELIELSRIYLSKCNKQYNQQLDSIMDKYSALNVQTAKYVKYSVGRQADLCKESVRNLIHKVVDSLSEGEKLAIDKLRRKVKPNTSVYKRDKQANLAKGIAAVLKEEDGDKIEKLIVLLPSEGAESLKKLFDAEIYDMCKKLVDGMDFPALMAGISSKSSNSLFIEEWLMNYNLCKDIRHEVELPESPLIQACFNQL